MRVGVGYDPHFCHINWQGDLFSILKALPIAEIYEHMGAAGRINGCAQYRPAMASWEIATRRNIFSAFSEYIFRSSHHSEEVVLSVLPRP